MHLTINTARETHEGVVLHTDVGKSHLASLADDFNRVAVLAGIPRWTSAVIVLTRKDLEG